MTPKPTTDSLPEEILFRKIHRIRDQKVLLDVDLAELYGVETKRLKEAVRRNIERFPDDFMFELTSDEWQFLRSQIVTLDESDPTLRTQSASSDHSDKTLRSQIVISNEIDTENLRSQIASSNRGGTRYPPFAFTEQGVAMLSSVLNSKRAVEVNIQIMRVFVKMRQWVTNYAELLQKIETLETEQATASGHITQIYSLIKELLEPEFKNRKPIGFRSSDNA